ncbi:MAG: ATP-binding protein [Bacteroidales bacterium]
MNKQDIKKVIVAQKELRPELRYVEREEGISKEVISTDPFIRIFSGVRRCGKSTLMDHIRNNSKEKNFCLSFDDNRLTGFIASDFEKLYEAFYELYDPEKTWYFDEIQNIEGWEWFIRRLHNEGHKVLITGSNANMLSRELGTHLTGRYLQTEIFPFSFAEYCRFREISIEPNDFYSATKTTLLKKAFREYIMNGGFPEFLQSGNSDYLKILFENILYRDVIARHNIRNGKLLMEMTHFLISNISKETSYNSLKNTFGLANAITVKEYISFLEDCYLLFSINKFDYSLKIQLANPKKIYCIDSGLAGIVSFQFSENYGRQLENLAFLHLRRKGAEIYYHRGNYECDFLEVSKKKVVRAIQVCQSIEKPTTQQRELSGLIEALKTYQLQTGLIVTEDEEETIEHNGFTIQVVPAWKFLLTDHQG